MIDRPVDQCLSDQELEDLLFRRLAGSDLEAVEEHLLFCPSCQERVKQEQRFVRDFRAAASPRRPKAFRAPPGGWTAYSALAASLVLGFWIFRPPPQVSPAVDQPARVYLTLTRSVSSDQSAAAPQDSPLQLSLDLEQLPSFEQYDVEVSSARGMVVFRRSASPVRGVLEVETPALNPGLYWVRLYGNGELLREYGLRSGS